MFRRLPDAACNGGSVRRIYYTLNGSDCSTTKYGGIVDMLKRYMIVARTKPVTAHIMLIIQYRIVTLVLDQPIASKW